jgi:cytochrome c peroxidase
MTNCRRINALVTGVLLGSIAVIPTLGADALGAEEASVTLSPKALEEIAQVEAEIDRIEAQTFERLAAPPDNQVQQIELLGKALLYDKNLSVNRNQACAFCHMPETGLTATSRVSNPSCISTTRAMLSRAVCRMIPVKARLAGLHPSRPRT